MPFVFLDAQLSRCKHWGNTHLEDMAGFILILAFLLATGVISITNWLALAAWRRSRDKHWSEQARLAYPVIVAARANLLSVPCILVLAVLLVWPDSSPFWLLSGMAALAGAYAGTFPLNHELFPRISSREFVRLVAFGILLRAFVWLVIVGAAVIMPPVFNEQALAIGLLVVILWAVWARVGLVWLGRMLGLFQPAPERLRKIVAETSARMNVPCPIVWLARSPAAQAFAMPNAGQLLFTDRLLAIMSDYEIAAVCAHELGHLTKSRFDRYSRHVQMLVFLPWIYFNPLTHAYGPEVGIIAFFGLVLTTLGIPRIYRKISRKLEARADTIAKANEGDAGTYARALARLYEDNLVPAVLPKSRATHPDLYDRLLAAGVTPDFSRPAAAKSMAWHGKLFAGALGVLCAIYLIFAMQLFSGSN